jgi:hypothetical protein
MGFGLSEKEIIQAILCNFMEIPKIDWNNPSLIANYYRLKQKYKVNEETLQLIARMEIVMPNWSQNAITKFLL